MGVNKLKRKERRDKERKGSRRITSLKKKKKRKVKVLDRTP